jgi:quercetin 2,3-dioxygenase
MQLTILRKADQVSGQFDGGRIKELKPLGFPQDRGRLRPYGSLFYWAYAWAESDSLIGEHPHKGFEILSFVLKGSLEHYDSQLRGWKRLDEGDVQIIRSGSGITHAEKLYSGAEMFQIWFDPGLERTLGIHASYDDYRGTSFQENLTGYGRETVYTANEGLGMMADDVTIKRMLFADGAHSLPLAAGDVASLFVLNGKLSFANESLQKGDFVRISDTSGFEIGTTDADVFIIITPENPPYTTYHGLMQSRMSSGK